MRWVGLILKNFLGVLLVILGGIMALLGIPGPGIVTIVLGVMLLNFPSKRRLERWLIRRPTVIHLAISRSREFGADKTGAHGSRDPEALEKLEASSQRLPLQVNPAASPLFIVTPLTGFSVQTLFSTHPPTAERVARLRQMARQMVYRSGD